MLGKRGLPLARPVPGYRPSPPLLAPDIPMLFLHRGIANFFLATAEEVNSLRLPRSASDVAKEPWKLARDATKDGTKDLSRTGIS